jgi:membrane-bound metal-dependent hydrolase YbcI (DUF457 family)
MDVGTHALASIALTRALLPRAPLPAWGVVLIAGTVADVDACSALAGPSTYLSWHHTYTHSFVASLATGAILGIAYLLLSRKSSPAAFARGTFFGTIALAGFLHLAMDACQSGGITPLWPFSGYRVSADWVAGVDPWIITILIAAILLPELARMVSDEIGARSKGPRGRVGAIVGFILVILYVGGRADFHANVLATIEGRSYRDESPRRAAAYPESVSLFTWHAIVETDRALHELTVEAAPGASFDPDDGTTLFKPESSTILERAQNAEAARKFLGISSFPKASVEKTPEGYQVQIRDLRYALSGEIRHEVVALVHTDSTGKVLEGELLWARNLRKE